MFPFMAKGSQGGRGGRVTVLMPLLKNHRFNPLGAKLIWILWELFFSGMIIFPGFRPLFFQMKTKNVYQNPSYFEHLVLWN